MKYFGLWFSFFKASLSADLEYRLNFALRVAMDILWYLAQIVTFDVIFRQTSRLGGWSLEEVRVFLGVLFISDALYMFLFSENLDHFSDKIRKGDLDLLLAKPVNSQFILTCQKTASAYIGNLALSFGWLIWAVASLTQPIGPLQILLLVIIIPAAVAIHYSIRFLFASLTIFLTRADNLQYVWYQLYKLGTRPDAIYPRWLRYVLLTGVPVAMIASVPASVFLGREGLGLFFWALFMAAAFLWFSRWIWGKALKSYSSASS